MAGRLVSALDGAIPLTSEDRAIVDGLRGGDPDALARLVAVYGPDLKAVAFSVTRDDAAAEDIAAETIAAAWGKISSLRNPDRLRPWLLKIASRQALQYVRRRPATLRLDDRLEQTAESRLSDFQSASDARVDLTTALARLPPQMRTVIALRYVTDLTVDDIAIVMGRSRNTVKTELRLGLRRLRETLPGL